MTARPSPDQHCVHPEHCVHPDCACFAFRAVAPAGTSPYRFAVQPATRDDAVAAPAAP